MTNPNQLSGWRRGIVALPLAAILGACGGSDNPDNSTIDQSDGAAVAYQEEVPLADHYVDTYTLYDNGKLFIGTFRDHVLLNRIIKYCKGTDLEIDQVYARQHTTNYDDPLCKDGTITVSEVERGGEPT